MNYIKIYTNLIKRATDRSVPKEVYTELHHIVPKCMGGTDDQHNLVRLTGREHFVAHLLLVKIYPHDSKLVYAAMRMAHQCNSGRYYEWLRKRHSENVSDMMLGNKHSLGRIRPATEKEAISNKMKGIPKSQETKAKMSESQKGNKKALGLVRGPMSEEQKFKISEAKRGFKHSEETKRKISEKTKGVSKNGRNKKIVEP